MVETRIADVIVPDVFNPYFIERTAELSALWQSGIVAGDPRIDALAAGGGKVIQMPSFQDLGNSDSEVLSDSAPLTLNNITSQKEDAHILLRGKAWGTNDLARALADGDPMAAIGDLVASYWARDWQRTLVQMLNGIFAGPLSASHRFDVPTLETGASPDASKVLGVQNVLNGFKLLGDNAEGNLTAIVMHSAVFYNLVAQKLVVFDNTNGTVPVDQTMAAAGNTGIPFFMGRRVIVDDGVPVRAGVTSGLVYSTYLFGAGSIGLGRANAPVPTETDRDTLAGVDILVNRIHYVLHPRGLSFAPTAGTGVSGEAPTNAELADSAKWSKVFEDKNIHIVEVRTNG
jgi:hypothetical protein